MQPEETHWTLEALRASYAPTLIVDANLVIRLVSESARQHFGLPVVNSGENSFGYASSETLKGRTARYPEGEKAIDFLNLNFTNAQRQLTEGTYNTFIDGISCCFECKKFRANGGDGSEVIWWSQFVLVSSIKADRVPFQLSNFSSWQNPSSREFFDNIALSLLENINVVVIAVAKNGQAVYQNEAAHNYLGAVKRRGERFEDWLEDQWGSTHANGQPLALEEYPIYQTSVLGVEVKDFELDHFDVTYVLQGKPIFNADGEHVGGMVWAYDISKAKREGKEKEANALMQSELKFSTIADNMEQIVWSTSASGQVSFFNRRWYEYTGASVEQSMGEHWYNFMHEEDVENTRSNWGIMMPDQDSFLAQHRLRGIDGTYRWFLARARCMRNSQGERESWLGSSTDVTQLTEALEEAKSTREHLLSVMQYASLQYYVIDPDMTMTSLILSVEDETEGLYRRYTRETIIRKSIRETLCDDLVKKISLVLNAQQPSAIEETKIGYNYWRTQFTPYRDGSGNICGVVGCAMDVTEDKLKDQQLKRADFDKNIALQSSTFKSEFLARMSHEIRTPIGGVLGMAELLKSTDLTEEQENFLDAILRSGENLLVIINDILDFSKIEVGKMDIEMLPFNLKLVVVDVFNASTFGPHRRDNVSFDLNFDLDENITLLGDRNRLKQILSNLSSNALKFTDSGSVTLNVKQMRWDEVTEEFGAKKTDDSMVVKFEVIDTGIGINSHALSKLFTPFTQADSTTARRFGGSGLGLSIARQLAALMSGTLTLESDGVSGTKASCIIPFSITSSAKSAQTETEVSPELGKGYTVLLVEDNKINQIIALNMLKKMGFTCSACNNGREALDYLQQQSSALPDLILMDCQMPLLDGYEATGLIRKDPLRRIRELPVIAMTASTIRGDREKCLAAGMNDYISKPVKQNHLGSVLSRWLSDKSGMRITQTIGRTHRMSPPPRDRYLNYTAPTAATQDAAIRQTGRTNFLGTSEPPEENPRRSLSHKPSADGMMDTQ